jgi:hypothetical protein
MGPNGDDREAATASGNPPSVGEKTMTTEAFLESARLPALILPAGGDQHPCCPTACHRGAAPSPAKGVPVTLETLDWR